MYRYKYCSKHGKRKGQAAALYEVLDDMESGDASARENFGDDYAPTKLGSKLHRAFMAEIGEEMCQNEVAHHANKCPEYLWSRPEKWVYLYKKGLAIAMPAAKKERGKRSAKNEEEEPEEDSATRPRVTAQRSDVDLYERCTQYRFCPEDTPPSRFLPAQETPEAQVAVANVWDFSDSCDSAEEKTLTWNGTLRTTCPSSSCPPQSS